MHYQPTRPPWINENEMIDANGQGNSAHMMTKRASSSNIDMSGGPPAYFPPTKEQPLPTRSPGLPSSQDLPSASYINHQSLNSPSRK